MEITRSLAASTADVKKKNQRVSLPPRLTVPLHLTSVEAYTTSLSVEIKHMDTSLDAFMPAPDLPRADLEV